MKKVLIITIIVLLAFLFGCKKYNNRHPYFIFGEVGNEWTYQYLKISTATGDTLVNEPVIYRIISEDGGGMFTYEYTLRGNVFISTWLISPNDFGQSAEDVYLTSSSLLDDVNVGDNAIIHVDEIVEVLGETILCFEVHTNYELIPDGTTLWINPDYGIVKQNSINTTEALRFQYILTDWNFQE
jgi:hypothetical protein